MFCFQCEQTAGICGRGEDTARLRDRLTGALIGLARATEGNDHMLSDSTAEVTVEALSATRTNVEVDNEVLLTLLKRVDDEKRKLVPECYNCASSCGRTDNFDMQKLWNAGEDIRSLKSLLLFGIRGLAAWACHAGAKGCRDEEIHRFLYRALFAVGMDDWGVEELLPMVPELGEVNLKCMAMLDRADTEAFGHPEQELLDLKRLPGFVSDNVKKLLTERYGIGAEGKA